MFVSFIYKQLSSDNKNKSMNRAWFKWRYENCTMCHVTLKFI